MSHPQSTQLVKDCYSAWSDSYYGQYYGAGAPYPPIHRDLVKRLLRQAKAKSVLDAGCGPASFLRELAGQSIDAYGFDLTREMVEEARRVLRKNRVPPDHVWEGSVLQRSSFRIPGKQARRLFDAAICIGVFPHIPEGQDQKVIGHLHAAVRKGGLVVIEARNQFFSLFTLNRYSHQFFLDELIRMKDLKQRTAQKAGKLTKVAQKLEKMFRMDLPPLRAGRGGKPGYDQVLSRTHNPLVLKEQFTAARFENVRLLFYHYHCLPPMFADGASESFRQQSLAMECPFDWRGYFMASAFLLAGERA